MGVEGGGGGGGWRGVEEADTYVVCYVLCVCMYILSVGQTTTGFKSQIASSRSLALALERALPLSLCIQI